MRKILLILLPLFCLFPLITYGDFHKKGAISGWRFAPLQLDASLVKDRRLVDESSHTFFAFGLFILRQKSAILSIAPIANTLQNNYGLQINPICMGTATDKNFGLSFGFENYCKKNYGIQLGLWNYGFAGEKIEKENERTQILGLNIADFLYIGLANFSNEIQLGLFNFSKDALFQVGLINFNPSSYIPWMPILNFNMGRKKN